MKTLCKTFCLFLILVSSLRLAYAKEYAVDPGHSAIGFDIRHLVTTVHGRFTDFTGTIFYDEKNPENSQVNFTVKASSINTENERRDQDLRSPNFFDVANFPDATFKSTSVTLLGDNKARVVGNLTIHGVTKPVTFDAEFLGEVNSPMGQRRAGFAATTTLNRKDYGIVWNKVLDNGGTMLGDEVKLHVDVEAILQCRTCGK